MHKIMGNKSFLLFAIFIIFCVPFTISQEVEDEHEFSYDVNSPNGPNHWGKIHPEWSLCNNGDMQSPVDLIDARVQTTSKLGKLDTNYKPANATLINRGQSMALKWIEGAGDIQINGTRYQLNQAHWHGPSEHTINGQRFSLEAQFVHESRDGKFAIIAILYELGHDDSFLAKIEPYLRALASTRENEISVGTIDHRRINHGNSEYYQYIGSLTTPACNEGVIWNIIRKVRTVSQEQLLAFRGAVHDVTDRNARPIQPLNNRWLQLYTPNDHETK